ncbi:MAG: glucose 1-dehydrogenase [Planctomycetales bacterium]
MQHVTSQRFQGQVAVVTGAAQGIGKGIAEKFLREGAKVALVDKDYDLLLATEAEFGKSYGDTQVTSIQTNVGSASSVNRMFDAVQQRLGGADVLVNNAAWAAPVKHFLEMTEAFWDEVLTTNLKSVYLCSQQFAKGLDARRQPGAIVNISTYGALRAQREMTAYNASKGGVEALTRTMAMDLAPWQIRVNAVGPGPIATPSFLELFNTPEKLDRIRSCVPLERLGKEEDIANAVAFLASGEASFITGQVLYVDGGSVSQIRPPAYTANLKRPANSNKTSS